MVVALQKYLFSTYFLKLNNSNIKKKKVAAVLEITGSHEECIYAQLLHLKNGGYHTLLICSANLEPKVFEFDQADEFFYFDVKEENKKSYFKLLQIRALLIRRGVEVVCINSAHGKLIQNLLLLPFPRKMKFFGVLHGINKLRKSITQKLISLRIKKYFLLNDYLIQNLYKVPHGKLEFESYYPIFFPEFKGTPRIDKPEGQIWVTVPGQVEYARRDYMTLIDAFAKLDNKPDIQFIFLGSWDHRDGNGPELKQRIEALGLTQYFRFTGYLQNPDFHAIIKASDIIMPLIHPGNDGFEKYLIYQITGSYNLAFAHHKPLLMLQAFDQYEDFIENGIFYSLESLPEQLAVLPQLIEKIKPQLYQSPKWTREYQGAKNLAFIEQKAG